jgi:hypothetical protein
MNEAITYYGKNFGFGEAAVIRDVDDAKAATAMLRQRGVRIDDPRVGRTISLITSVTDPTGVRMELSEIGPESMLGKAIASWR